MRALRSLLLAGALLAIGCPSIIDVPQDAGSSTGPADAGGADGGSADGGSDGGPVLACGLTFGYQNGYPCNTDTDCEGHHCAVPLPSGESSPGVCTTTCTDDGATDECMAGYACSEAYSISFEGPTDVSYALYCVPQAGTQTLPDNGTLPLGSPCRSGADCAGSGATCGAYDYGYYRYTFCAPPCGATGDASCGGCGTCTNPFPGQQDYCLFAGSAPIGASCVHHADCASFLCQGFCTAECATAACPAGSLCETFQQDGESGALCVAPDQIGGTADGSACVFDFQCTSTSRCLQNDTGATVCTPLGSSGNACSASTDCAAGLDCVQVASNLSECTAACGVGCAAGQSCFAPDIDIDLRLFDSIADGDDGFVAYANGADEGLSPWSTIASYAVTPGNWWVSVRADPGNFTGAYQLLITDGSGTPTPWQELPETPVSNNTLANSQQIPFPVDLSGTLSSDTDIDDYEFTVTQATTVTIQTAPGTPTACLPSAQVGEAGSGNPCTETFNCTAGLTCNATLQLCTTACTPGGGDCGTETCASLGGAGNVCVPAVSVGGTADGAACSYGWQCVAGDDCVQSGGQSLCAAPCGSGMSCGANNRACGPATGSSGLSTSACLPLGPQTAQFGAACVLQSDCATGLTCTGGRCAQSCQSSAACPFQSGFTPDPLVCKPCQTDGDCATETEEGTCLVVDANEGHCVFPCSTAGSCTAGFTCTPSFEVDSSAALCVPSDGSCHTPVCAASDQCSAPPAGYAEGCAANADCSTGLCDGGLCSSACASNADCQCPAGDFACSSGTCGLLSSYLRQSGGNSSYATAQQIGAPLPVTIVGTFTPTFTAAFYAVSLTNGEVVDFVTRPLCGTADTAASTNVLLYGPSGNLIQVNEYSYTYADLHDVTIATSGTYTIEVQSTAAASSEPVPYILAITQKQ